LFCFVLIWFGLVFVFLLFMFLFFMTIIKLFLGGGKREKIRMSTFVGFFDFAFSKMWGVCSKL
jgi:hypothetical protein